jgi:DNA polymerase type B, organellar and viral
MYIPHADNNLFAYDVNSLYPSMMKNFDMPIGKPTFFEGDIRKFNKNAFGFFFCNILAPENLNEPIIQTHVNTSEGIRTIAPLGS